MNIAIAPFATTFLDLFVNLAGYLRILGHEVTFVNPDPYIAYLLRDAGFFPDFYKQNNFEEDYYSRESPLVQQYCRLYHLDDIDAVIKRKNTEYARAKRYFQNYHAKKVILWNGENNVESDVCKTLGIETFFCENGYFPNTFQMNRSGVNSRAEFANLSFSDFMNFTLPNIGVTPVHFEIKHIKQSIIQRYIFRFFSREYRVIMKEALKANQKKRKAKRSFRKAPIDQIDIEKLGNWAFFPLQVNSDTQIVLNSPYESMYQVLEHNLPKLINAGYKVVLKEHPDEVELVDYSHFVDNERIFLVKKFDINELISRSDFTIAVNSSVGLQAVAAGKPVVVLGDSFYLSAPNTSRLALDCNKVELAVGINNIDTEAYISHMKNDIFIKGDWRNITIEFLQLLCSRILA
ncbi:MAG: hypothetical protein ACK5MI_08765 [Mangrovibacterium sp.]